jgi:MSHA biogenesis protein MshE
LASALQVIIAQRLVRRICEHCTSDSDIEPAHRTWLENSLNCDSKSIQFKQGTGCHHCNHTGYRGRIGVYELLEMRDDTLDALRRSDSAAFTLAAKSTPGFVPFNQCALEFVRQGITSLDEVIRITGSGA